MAAELKTPEQALALRTKEAGLAMKFGNSGIQLTNYQDALNFGAAMIQSGYVPRGVTTAAQVVWMVQTGAELGIGPSASLRAFYMAPSGKPELYAKSALGICVSRGALNPDYDLYTEGEGESLVGHFKFQRNGWKEKKHRQFPFTDAKMAGLVKQGSNWEKWAVRMVQARVVAFALNDYFADVLMGCPLETDNEAKPPEAAEVTEISREISPAPPDPLFEQLKDKTATQVDAGWDDTLSGEPVEPDADPIDAGPPYPDGEPAANPIPLATEPEPLRALMATKQQQDFFWGLCRSRGMTDIGIAAFLGTHGYERVDQITAEAMPKLQAAVKEIKIAKR
jgi:hypothetical protein